MTFRLFGFLHLSILAAIVAIAFGLSTLARRDRATARVMRVGLGVLLMLNELIWYVYRYHTEGMRFPFGLPLQLCDFTVWLTAIAAVSSSPLIYECAYFMGVAGAGMALITPDLWAPLLSYPTLYFFLSHGLEVMTLLVLLWAGLERPRRGSVWRAFAALNIYTVAVSAFNWLFTTNYMYLRVKPKNASPLDYLGPWPLYILSGEVLALALFWLLWWPLRETRMASSAAIAETGG